MLKILPKTSHQLSICEGNFLRLKKVLQNFKKTNTYLKPLILIKHLIQFYLKLFKELNIL